MFCRIPMKIIDSQGAPAVRKTPHGKCIRPASCPTSAAASRGFEARRGTDSFLVMGTIGPNLVSTVEAIVDLPHPFDCTVRKNAFRKIEPVIGRRKAVSPWCGREEQLPGRGPRPPGRRRGYRETRTDRCRSWHPQPFQQQGCRGEPCTLPRKSSQRIHSRSGRPTGRSFPVTHRASSGVWRLQDSPGP
jgi:hypothetical protein